MVRVKRERKNEKSTSRWSLAATSMANKCKVLLCRSAYNSAQIRAGSIVREAIEQKIRAPVCFGSDLLVTVERRRLRSPLV